MFKDAVLMIRIHLHAFRYAPRSYLTALWWRLLGKKVRSRARLAPLLSQSPLTYRLWLRSEPPLPYTSSAHSRDLSIVALIDVSGHVLAEEPRLRETLISLEAEGIVALQVGSSQTPTLADAAQAIDWNKTPWTMPLQVGDVLAPGTAAAYRDASLQCDIKLVYADDDLIDTHGQRANVHFKPSWNAELFRHFDYLTGACIVQASPEDLIAASGDGWATRLVANAVAHGATVDHRRPEHIPHVLHHRRERPLPCIQALSGIEDVDLPLVSVIVPTRNGLDLLRTCLNGVALTNYPRLEVIVVDNGSDDPATLAYLDALDPTQYQVLRDPRPFNFSALNNLAVKEAKGTVICLLNNDIEIIAPDWLKIMVRQALRSDVGAVGAQLFYPDGRIQHAGVVTGICEAAAHAHRLLRSEDDGYFRRHALPQFVSAVTAAVLVVQRERFEAVGGLDEENFAVAFNDVDLCLRLNARGWQSLYEPRAQLIHHESVSRGLDRDPIGAARLASELAMLKALWRTDKTVDPYHHPQLNKFSEHFVVKLQVP